MIPHPPRPNEAVARAARERSEQERETTGVSAGTMFNPRPFLAGIHRLGVPVWVVVPAEICAFNYTQCG